ncbi:MAG: helix-turn-helix domain-containing protein [Lachnospiraceae bacterium]
MRKEKGWNQKQLASMLGITQSGVSYMEQQGSTVADSSIKTICSVCNLSEDWLRHGNEPMYVQPQTFSLDQFAAERGMTDNDLKIVKAYFELEPDIRKSVIEFFRSATEKEPATTASLYDEAPKTAKELEEQYPTNSIADEAEIG